MKGLIFMFFNFDKLGKNAFRGDGDGDDENNYDYDYEYSDELLYDGEYDDDDGFDDGF